MKKKRPVLKWRWLFAACAVYGGLRLLGGVAVHFLATGVLTACTEAASIGIIGGADGPTAVFVTGPAWTGYLPSAILLAVGAAGYYLCRKEKKKAP